MKSLITIPTLLLFAFTQIIFIKGKVIVVTVGTHVLGGKVQYGSGWWFLGQKDGVEKQLYCATDKNVNKILFVQAEKQCGSSLHRPLVLNTIGEL